MSSTSRVMALRNGTNSVTHHTLHPHIYTKEYTAVFHPDLRRFRLNELPHEQLYSVLFWGLTLGFGLESPERNCERDLVYFSYTYSNKQSIRLFLDGDPGEISNKHKVLYYASMYYTSVLNDP